MLLCVLLLLSALAHVAQTGVEVRASEVWIIKNGNEIQVTFDGKSKTQAILSPSQKRAAYYEVCPEAEHCVPTIIILDSEGRQIVSFHPKRQSITGNEACPSILSIETNLTTLQTTRSLLGYGFTPSPDGRQIAHAGWIPHFGPPYAQSNYLQIDHAIIYPLPEGMVPFELKAAASPPNVVNKQGLIYSGIHQFMPGFSWSPDGRHIALVDCTYDWKADYPEAASAGEGERSNFQCSIAVVSLKGGVESFPLTELTSDDVAAVRLVWSDRRRLSFKIKDSVKTVAIR
jgi:hypothetical protein